MKNPLSLLTVVAATALSLTACDESPARVCTDQLGRRVDDGLCANRAGGASGGWGGGSGGASGGASGGGGNSWLYRWYYMRGGSAPAVGGFASGGSFTPEAGVSYSSVSRGGFGGEARAFGGFHGFG